MGGLIVSVTTDGFITNLENLEDSIISNIKCQNSNYLLTKFRSLREDLSNSKNARFDFIKCWFLYFAVLYS